jgi:hypothetical protein
MLCVCVCVCVCMYVWEMLGTVVQARETNSDNNSHKKASLHRNAVFIPNSSLCF